MGIALLYAYKAAAGHSVNGNPMHPISLVISEAGPIQFASKTVYNENEVEYGYVFADDNVCAMAGISKNDNDDYSPEELAILADVSPYCVAQDFDENTTIPYTILAYGYGVPAIDGTYDENFGDGLVPIQPAIDLDALLNTNAEYVNHSKCSLFEFAHIPHDCFGIAIHHDTSNLSSRMQEYCTSNDDHNGTNNTLCSICSNIYTSLLYEPNNISGYYDIINQKLNQ